MECYRGKVLGLADEVESAQGFPDLLDCGIDGRQFRSGLDGLTGLREECANPSGDRGTDFDGLLVVLQFGDQAALADRSAGTVGIDDAASDGRRDFSGLQECDDLRRGQWCPRNEPAKERRCRAPAAKSRSASSAALRGNPGPRVS